MSFYSNSATTPRDEHSDPFLDALDCMTSNDSGSYVGIGALRNSDVFTAVRVIASDLDKYPIEYSEQRNCVLLKQAPHDHMTAWALQFASAEYMLLNGNSFARVK